VEEDFAGVVDFLEIVLGELCELLGGLGEEDVLAEVLSILSLLWEWQ
jgi:hypothetical protein